ncbi:MAG: CHAD domain-containing protein [Pseudobdellovibrionaceae bacterium]
MDILEKLFPEQIKIFNKLLRSQARRLSLDGVHDLRVNTRRLRTFIRLLEKSTSHKMSKDSKEALKKLGDALGERRQWDVTLEWARKYQLKEGSLLKDQKTSGNKLHQVLRSSEVQKLPPELEVFEKGLGADRISVQDKLLQRMDKDLKKWFQRKRFSKKEIHRLRISTKKIRYAFEALDLPVENLKELQDELGKCHDLTVLSQYFHQPKQIKKKEKKEYKKAQKQIRPALRSSIEVLQSLR